MDVEEVYNLADYEEDEPGNPSFRGLSTSSPIQPRETSGERSDAQVPVSQSQTLLSQCQPNAMETQESTDDERASGERASRVT